MNCHMLAILMLTVALWVSKNSSDAQETATGSKATSAEILTNEAVIERVTISVDRSHE